jgi:hypothetical protein
MPESVTDRCTKSHEYIFLLAKSARYYYDAEAIKEPCTCDVPAGNKTQPNKGRIGKEGWALDPAKSIPEDGRNRRSVWTVATQPYGGAHFAVFPSDLIEPCILAGCPPDGIVLDPFMGSGTTAAVALSLGAVVPLYQAEKNMFETRMRFNPAVPESKTALYEFATKTLNTKLLEPGYKLTAGNYLVASGFSVEGLGVLNEVIKTDPRNLDALTSLSEFNQQLGNLEEVITYRLQISTYDPFNAANYLQLGRNYKALGNVSKMNEMRAKILSFAPNTEEAKQAISELN